KRLGGQGRHHHSGGGEPLPAFGTFCQVKFAVGRGHERNSVKEFLQCRRHRCTSRQFSFGRVIIRVGHVPPRFSRPVVAGVSSWLPMPRRRSASSTSSRARCSQVLIVPTGRSSSSAISSYDCPCSWNKTNTSRNSSRKSATARAISAINSPGSSPER